MSSSLTKEEKRLIYYASNTIPTKAEEVTNTTPLDDFNLNWREQDLPENERTRHVHRLHPYLGKYIPQLVEIFLRKYFAPGQTVVDPFAGSGTTLVQANELGIHSIGCDISAFNVMLCRAKTARYDLNLVKQEILSILEKVRQLRHFTEYQEEFKKGYLKEQLSFWEVAPTDLLSTNPVADVPEISLRETSSSYLEKWFAPQALEELIDYRNLIETNYHYQDILKVILCRSARSARLTTHYDLDFPKQPQTEPYYCYKHSRECRPTNDAFKFLERYSLDTIKRLEQFSTVRSDATIEVYHDNSQTVTLPSIDGVLTSPPYVGLIDYHDQHAYAYHLLGLDDRRSDEIGPAAGGSSIKSKAKYQKEIACVFSRLANVIPSGGRIIVVAADKANLYPDIAKMIGLEEEAVVQRHVNRRTGRRSGEFYESVFVWRKM